jgi:hypothetical protein
MAALTAHRGMPTKRNDANPIQGAGLIETSAIVFEGALLVADATTGLLKPAADAGAGATKFVGICTGFIYASTIPSTGVVGDGTIQAKYETGFEVLLPCAGTVTVADGSKAAYCLDDEGVTDVSTAGPQCGIFCPNGQESATTVWVRLHAPAMGDAT